MKKRIISAIVALIIVIPLIYLGGIYFKVGVSLLAALAFKEVIDLPKSHEKYPWSMEIIGLIALLIITLTNGFSYEILTIVILMLLLPTVFLKNYNTKDAFYLLGFTIILGVASNTFITIRDEGLYLFLYLVLIPMVNDVFAYLIGISIGKHKMAKEISPNKTWEGAIAGFITSVVAGLIYYKFLIGPLSIKVILTTIVLSIAGDIGDLVMSKIKRENEIKDFSNIMPGHGGILDRLDSTIFVFLTYIFLLAL